jgi:hypothetical protein
MSLVGHGLTRESVRVLTGLPRNRTRGAAPEWRDRGFSCAGFRPKANGQSESAVLRYFRPRIPWQWLKRYPLRAHSN